MAHAPAKQAIPTHTSSHTASPTHAQVDAYIANAAPFAQPILERLRALVQQVVPAVDETMK